LKLLNWATLPYRKTRRKVALYIFLAINTFMQNGK